MRKQVLFILFGIIVFSGSALYFSRNTDPSTGTFVLDQPATGKDSREDKMRNAKDAMLWRYNKLKDENGNVDPSYLQKALAQADQLKRYGSRSALGLQWDELGPDNVGGRTRSILIDARDPSGNTVYAGGVGGGMWKSTDAGNTWNRLANWNQWLAVSCITQGPSPCYTIYIGTGEGLANCCPGTKFNSGTMGNGIFTLDGNDNPVPFAFNDTYYNNEVDPTQIGAMINRIAIDPQDGSQMVVATGSGLWQTTSADCSTYDSDWIQPTMPGIRNGQSAADVKWSSDGSIIFAAVGGNSRLTMSPDGGQDWFVLTSQRNTGFPTQQGRIEIAIAPSDPNYVYLMVATGTGCTYGLYRTTNAIDSGIGCSWSALATAGPLFDPFATGECQGWYDNTVAVNPFNPNKAYLGGVNFYTWGDESGAQLADAGLGGGVVNPYYIHPDKHTIVFSNLDSNVMYVGCDGGIYKSTDAGTDFPYPTFSVKNRGYNVTQNYTIGAAITGEVMGGSQDNGTNYINFKGNTIMSSNEVLGGDGSYSEISHLDPKVFFAGIYYGEYDRSGNYAQSFDPFFDIKIDPAGANQPSRCGGEVNTNAPFIADMYLSETRNAANGLSTVPFGASQIYNIGDTISLLSNTDALPFQYTLTTPLNVGDTILVNDPFRSRVFLSTYCGTWLTSDALELSGIPRWYKLINSMTGTPDSYAATANGDTLYVGTSSGIVYSFSNLNARCDTTSYPPGSTDIGVIYPSNNLYGYSLVASGGRDIQGISVDPTNSLHVAAVVAGYSTSNQPHVYESQNGGQSWVADTGGLPNMPVYDVVVHDANTIIIASELGMWSWDGSSWHEENNGFPRMPVYRLVEKELYNNGCQVLYLGTHGRGMWRSTTLTAGGCQLQSGIGTGVANVKAPEMSGLNIFPNPVRTTSQISLTLDKSSDVVMRIFDMTGKLCQEVPHQYAVAGENLYALDSKGLSSGTYLLSATVANSRTQSRLFTVTK